MRIHHVTTPQDFSSRDTPLYIQQVNYRQIYAISFYCFHDRKYIDADTTSNTVALFIIKPKNKKP